MRTFEYDSIDSTNAEAKRLVHTGKISEPSCIVAREQTSGRGTRDRTWQSPRDAGIYLTIVYPTERRIRIDPHELTPQLGRVCANVLCEETGVDVVLRGVNDLYVEDRKLGGILTEVLMGGDAVRAVIVGIGINTRADAVCLPPKDPTRPVALGEIASRPFDAGGLVQCLSRAIEGQLGEYLCGMGEAGEEA